MTKEERLEAAIKSKPFNRLDIAFFACAIVVIAVIAVMVFAGKDGASVTVTTKRGASTYPLSVDAEIDVEGKLTLVIEDGKAYVKDANCPDKVCEHTGRISRSGQMIACLPEGIVITVDGNSDFAEVG
ncbi:MAG: NusG domain II-containing protein [Clostridia bacterium]|nr:NusG domain II-containing protein [Clostridia bacterium]